MVTVILLGSNALPQSDFERLGMSANELARRSHFKRWLLGKKQSLELIACCKRSGRATMTAEREKPGEQ
jgi:hypothetical protein